MDNAIWEVTRDTTVHAGHPALQFAAKIMVKMLREQGLPARLWEGYVVFGVAEYWGICREATIRPGDGGIFVTSLMVDLYTDRNKTYTVTDTIAGVAVSARESMAAAVDRYLDSVFTAFHAMHDPRFIREGSPRMHLESYSPVTRRKTRWEVFTGGMMVVTGEDAVEELLQTMRKKPPLSMILDEVTGLLAADDRLHWVKIFGCRQATGEVVSECALDNRLSAQANRLLDGFAWPRSDMLQSFRWFHVLRPQR